VLWGELLYAGNGVKHLIYTKCHAYVMEVVYCMKLKIRMLQKI